MDEERFEQSMSVEQMQRFLDWCAIKGMNEKDAYDGLMFILGLHYLKPENSGKTEPTKNPQ